MEHPNTRNETLSVHPPRAHYEMSRNPGLDGETQQKAHQPQVARLVRLEKTKRICTHFLILTKPLSTTLPCSMQHATSPPLSKFTKIDYTRHPNRFKRKRVVPTNKNRLSHLPTTIQLLNQPCKPNGPDILYIGEQSNLLRHPFFERHQGSSGLACQPVNMTFSKDYGRNDIKNVQNMPSYYASTLPAIYFYWDR